jgi:pimeloyl-ACP methyl ester carboxylesterase
MPAIADREEEVGGLRAFWREAEPARPGLAPVLYVHGVPTHSDDWLPFLERTGGVAPDLPGFGRSDKPAQFDYSIGGYSRWLEALAERTGIDRFSVVVHDWGSVGLMLAQAHPERVERVVVINALPFLPGYRWHRAARIWRTPLAGELFMGFSTRWGFKQLSREATPHEGPMSDELIDRAWKHFDHGTQRAILKLYRSAPPHELARAGQRLGEITAPALVVWGRQDPYLPTEFAERYADALGGPAQVELIDQAGHWPWIDQPRAIDLVCSFLLAE